MCSYCYKTYQRHLIRLIILCHFRIWRTRLASRVLFCSGHSYLSRRSQFVEINDIKSSVRALTVGVPQGSVLSTILYLLYTASLAEIIRSRGLDYHFYDDDTQLYISFKDYDVDVARLRVENCVADICHWMDVNELKHDKIETMLIYSKYHTGPVGRFFCAGGGGVRSNDETDQTCARRASGGQWGRVPPGKF